MSLLTAFAVVAVSGGVGAVVRFALALWSGQIPWGILIANSLGSLIAGLALGSGAPEWILVGLAGGISTFSTFAAQTHQLLIQGKVLNAIQNLTLNLVLPAAMFFTGFLLV
jgi:fluoride exporter